MTSRIGHTVAATFFVAFLVAPNQALALQGHQGQAPDAPNSAVTVEETGSLAMGWSHVDGDYVFESLRFTGVEEIHQHTFSVWGWLEGSAVTFYVEHADGSTETIYRTVPAPSGTPGEDDYLSSIDLDFRVNDWTIVTEVVTVIDPSLTPGGGTPGYSIGVPYVEQVYEDYADKLVYEHVTANSEECEVTLVSSESSLGPSPSVTIVPTLETPGDPDGMLKRYAYGYYPPAEGGTCLGSYEFSFTESGVTEESRKVSAGFRVRVGEQYVGMKAAVFVSSDERSEELWQRHATHEMTIGPDGTFTVPFAEFLYESYSDGARVFLGPLSHDEDGKVTGVMTINVEPIEKFPNGRVVDYNGHPRTVETDEGYFVTLESCDLNLDLSGFEGDWGFFDFTLSATPYTDEAGVDDSGYVSYRVDVGERLAGRRVKVSILRDEASPPELEKYYTVGEDGTFLLTDRVDVRYGQELYDPMSPGRYHIIADISVETVDISKSGIIADISDQEWTGLPITPGPVVTAGGLTLEEGADYTLSYEENTAAGTGIVIVSGIGAYSGELRAQFEIVRSPGGQGDPSIPTGPDDEPDAPEKFECDGGEECPSGSYPDVIHGAWYHEAIDWAVNNDVVKGYDDGSFGPNDSLSRAQMATVLWRLAGAPEVEAVSLPADCGRGTFYEEAVSWALGRGIFSGYEGGAFGPADSITREQVAVVLYRRAGKPTERVDLSGFRDSDYISEFARDAMSWVVANDILTGTSSGSLEPTRACTRAELSALLMRMDKEGKL